jgi:hypothetical protein
MTKSTRDRPFILTAELAAMLRKLLYADDEIEMMGPWPEGRTRAEKRTRGQIQTSVMDRGFVVDDLCKILRKQRGGGPLLGRYREDGNLRKPQRSRKAGQ